MDQALPALEPIYSAYGHDPDLEELVADFASELPIRVEKLRNYLECEAMEILVRATQQLLVSADKYGFDQIVPHVERLEKLLQRSASRGEIKVALEEVIEMCERVRPGGPE